MSSADLELSLHRWYADSYAIELRFRRPGSDADIPPVRAEEVPIDLVSLRELSQDIKAYGQLLTQTLFKKEAIRDAFVKARAIAEEENLPLRLRLFVTPTASELNALRWETLRDPTADEWLLTSENLLFSRYLTSSDWRPIRLRSQRELRALVTIASPSDLEQYKPGGRTLDAIDKQAVFAQIEPALGKIKITKYSADWKASLNNISSLLREEHDILYLMCHGALIERDSLWLPKLWLEDEEGKTAIIDGSDLVSALNDLQYRPKLVVLASCQSAGQPEDASSTDEGALASLGPRLVMEAGIPAVLAMQGNISIQTASDFMRTLFQELQRDGQIDRAMAAARGAVRKRDDSWMPVLFMRLTTGRIWHEPGFAGDRDRVTGKHEEFGRWEAVVDWIKRNRCTPIIGSGLLEPIVGSTKEIARSWADAHHYPMAPEHIEDLPQVAEYLAVTQSEDKMRSALREYVNQRIKDRFGNKITGVAKGESTEELISEAGSWLRTQDPNEPHKVLAGLPFPIYISTNPDSLLADALREAGKKPKVELCRWNTELEWPVSVYDTNPDYQPTVDAPLVYHLFGSFSVEDSVVLTEDNYFDYLIGITRGQNPIPTGIRTALVNSAFLFLGFQLDDWAFRVIFRSIMALPGRRLLKKYTHTAVQINPEETHILDAERARKYLQDRFQDAKINIYWGDPDDFAKELQSAVKRFSQPAAAAVV